MRDFRNCTGFSLKGVFRSMPGVTGTC